MISAKSRSATRRPLFQTSASGSALREGGSRAAPKFQQYGDPDRLGKGFEGIELLLAAPAGLLDRVSRFSVNWTNPLHV